MTEANDWGSHVTYVLTVSRSSHDPDHVGHVRTHYDGH